MVNPTPPPFFFILWWLQRTMLCVCWFSFFKVSFLFHLGLLSFICSVVSDFLHPHGLQYARLACPSLSPKVCSNSCLLNWRCHRTISSSVTPFSSCPQSVPESGSFLMSRLLVSGGQTIGVSDWALVLPINNQHWFSLEMTGLISLLF